MEVLHLYGTEEQKKKWLEPLLRGEIHSCFCMTVTGQESLLLSLAAIGMCLKGFGCRAGLASSDATNVECSIHQDGESYVIVGKKWWAS
eukprot:g27955.t1